MPRRRSTHAGALVAGVVVFSLLLAASAAASPRADAPSLGPSPTGLPQTWIASMHVNGHVFHVGQTITLTAHVNAATCFVPNPPCVGTVTWPCGNAKPVPHGTPTLHCSFKATEASGWQVVGANFGNPTGTSAVSEDFYAVVGKDKHVLDGTVRNKSGGGVSGVLVSARGARAFTAHTDANGYYNAILPKGRYAVSAPAEGSAAVPQRAAVNLVDKKTVNFDLKSRPLTFTYEMAQRFGLDNNHDGLIDYFTDPGSVQPSTWNLDFTLKREGGQTCHSKDTYTWTIDGGPAGNVQQPEPCHFVVPFPSEGTFKVAVTGKTTDGHESDGEGKTAVQDWLIVGIGDSVASGEGDPDVFGTGKGIGVKWEEPRCDRSARSFEPQAALAIEKADKHTSVTFVHLACSGAGVDVGEVGPYWGIEPGGATIALPSQVSQMQSLVGGREIDAVIVSIGANDMGFGSIVTFCAGGDRTAVPVDVDNACMTKRDVADNPFDDKKLTLDQVVVARIARLNCSNPAAGRTIGGQTCKPGGAYGELAARLKEAGVQANRVYITEYFDPSTYPAGHYCEKMIDNPLGVITQEEATWASVRVVHGLNKAVHEAAARNGWNFVPGGQDGFDGHGYCAPSGESYMTTVLNSLSRQGNSNGAMHPNPAGHLFIANLVERPLRRDLYPGNQARPPRQPPKPKK